VSRLIHFGPGHFGHWPTRGTTASPFQDQALSRYDAPFSAMGLNMRRREFIGLLGGVAAYPLAVRAQQPKMPLVGFLQPGAPENAAHYVAAFIQGLRELGYVEGQNVAIEYRWGEGQYARLPALAQDLVNHQVAVIAAGGPPSALAAKSVTSTIPIVFIGGDIANADTLALVGSLKHPTGNLTGMTVFVTAEMWSKRLELLRELIPSAASATMLISPSEREEPNTKQMLAAAQTLGMQLSFVTAETDTEIEEAFKTMVDRRTAAFLISDKPFFTVRHDHIVMLAARYAVPTVYAWREYVAAGGLISYGSSLSEAWRKVGTYVGRILNGEKPADLPVQQPTKFELVINVKTAKALGLNIPDKLLAIADEVIE
jgi:putative tryptophan/tyrosine transport system substrate-binding protein